MPSGPVLPAAVRDLAARLGVPADTAVSAVAFSQTGRMRQDADSAWMRFGAAETMATEDCCFRWLARTGPLGLVRIEDAFGRGGGRLVVRALGLIPVASTRSSPQLDRGELMRYLAELAWAPDAILRNPLLRWRMPAPGRIAVAAGEGEAAGEVVLELDEAGRIASAFAPDRPRAVAGGFVPTPWRGRFSDYRRHAGRWLPFSAAVGWELEGREVVVWEGRVTGWRLVSDSL
jgi:hypothetical protein